MLDNVTKELQCEENVEADSTEELHEIIEEFQVLPMMDEMLPARGVFCQ